MKIAGLHPAAALGMGLYSAMVFATISKHEPWADEAQSWLLARDNSLPDLIFHALRYEGSPGLWHFVNWLASHAGLPYAAINWIGGCFAVTGVYLLLRFAPFPLLLRLMLPFTFFLGYQYAVVARNYVLAPVLCFAIAHAIRTAPQRVLLLALLLGLLANVSSHGCIVAGCLAVGFVWTQRGSIDWRRAMPAGLLFGAFCLLAVLSARPASDFGFVNVQAASVVRAGGLVPKLARAAEVFTYPFGSGPVAGFAALAGIAVMMRRKLVYLLAVPSLMAFFALVYVAPWHTGMMFVAVVTGMWIAWPERYAREAGFVLCVILAAQLPWTWHAVKADFTGAYDGSREAAGFLQSQGFTGKVFGYGPYSAAVSAYFPAPVFANQKSTYWVWSKNNRSDLDVGRIGREGPEVLVICGIEPQNPKDALAGVEEAAKESGYTPIAAFRGRAPMREGFREVNLYRVWARREQAALY